MRFITASVIGLLLLTIVLHCGPVVSASDEAPEIVVLRYLRALYVLPTTEMFSAATYPDQSHCSAYALLSEETRAKVSAQDFLAYARVTLTSFENVELVWARPLKDNRVRVQARYSVDTYKMSTALTISLAKDATYNRFENYQLTKDPDGWRIVLDAVQFTMVLRGANAYRTLVKQDSRFGLPPVSCGVPGATK